VKRTSSDVASWLSASWPRRCNVAARARDGLRMNGAHEAWLGEGAERRLCALLRAVARQPSPPDNAIGVWTDDLLLDSIAAGSDLSTADCAARLPDGCVVDGVLPLGRDGPVVVGSVATPPGHRPVKGQTAGLQHPASFIAFDVRAVAGVDVQRRATRRSRLEDLAGWDPPLRPSAVTTDRGAARGRYDVLPAATGGGGSGGQGPRHPLHPQPGPSGSRSILSG
jgi:hypothetical protein